MVSVKRTADPLPGIAAKWPSDCARCPNQIDVDDRIVFSRGRPIHVGCASGSEDA